MSVRSFSSLYYSTQALAALHDESTSMAFY